MLPALTELVRYREEQNTSVQASDPRGKEGLSCTKVPGDTSERNQHHLTASRCIFSLEFGIYSLEEHIVYPLGYTTERCWPSARQLKAEQKEKPPKPTPWEHSWQRAKATCDPSSTHLSHSPNPPSRLHKATATAQPADPSGASTGATSAWCRIPTAWLGPASKGLSDESIFHPGERRKAPCPAPCGMQTQPSSSRVPYALPLPRACLSVGAVRLCRAADKEGSERGPTPQGCWQ